MGKGFDPVDANGFLAHIYSLDAQTGNNRWMWECPSPDHAVQTLITTDRAREAKLPAHAEAGW